MPNVLLLTSDEHNPFYSSVYGHPLVRTPNLDRLAAMGTVFEHAYCASPLCIPSRSAFLTGRPVHQIRVYNNCKAIRFRYKTYGSVLSEQGVHTAYIGNAAMFCHPNELGFREMMLAKEPQISPDRRFIRGQVAVLGEEAVRRADQYGPKEDAAKGDVRKIDRAVDWLLHTAPEIKSDWTLTVNLSAPHFPHYARPEYWQMYAGRGDLPAYGREEASANHPYALDHRAHYRTDEFTEEQVRGLREGYYACVSYVDAELGRLLDALEQSGQLDQTVVVYTSDHGEMLGKFGMWWKGILYEDAVRVPLVVAGPGFAAGRRVRTPVTHWDLQAAIFRSVSAVRPPEWWGVPLQDLSDDDDARVVFAEYHGHGVRSGSFMVRQGEWKLIFNAAAPHQLFNLRHDPHERFNLAVDEPGVLRRLEAELRSICNPEAVNEEAHAFEAHQLEALRRIERGEPPQYLGEGAGAQ